MLQRIVRCAQQSIPIALIYGIAALVPGDEVKHNFCRGLQWRELFLGRLVFDLDCAMRLCYMTIDDDIDANCSHSASLQIYEQHSRSVANKHVIHERKLR